MAKELYFTPSFHQCIRWLDPQQRERTGAAVDRFDDFLHTGHGSSGLGFKKLAANIFEFRVDVHLRVAGVVEEDRYYLYVAGTHDEIRRFLKARR